MADPRGFRQKGQVLLAVLAFSLWAVSQSAGAQTLHAVIVADTSDASIGVSVKKDFDRNISLVNAIARNTTLTLSLHALTGSKLTLNNLRNTVKGLKVGKNDAVLFYYSGHGYRLWAKKSKWPLLYVSQQGLDFGELVDTIRRKKPRFFLAVTDSCNEYADKRPERRSFAMKKGGPPKLNYRRLWVETHGEIVIGSSSKGEFAWGDDTKGGYFSARFFASHQNEVKKAAPNWENILKTAKRPISLTWENTTYTQNPMVDSKVSYKVSAAFPNRPGIVIVALPGPVGSAGLNR